MIVRPYQDRLLVVRQTDHMIVSGRLAEAWGNDQFARPEPFGPLETAAAEHDVGWAEWEAAPKVDPASKRPYQFTDMPVEEHLTFYQRGVNIVAARDAHAGLLVNLHCQGFHNQRFGTAPEMTLKQLSHRDSAALRHALIGLQAQQRTLGRQVRVESAVLWAQYELLQFFDRMSLLLCMPPVGPRELGPIPRAVGSGTIALQLSGDGTDITVDPWPFRDSGVAVEVTGRLVEDRDYVDEDDLRGELTGTEAVMLRYTLKPLAA